MRHFTYLILFIACIGYAQNDTESVNTMLDNWHKAAAEANLDAYMSKLTDDAIYIGTDATENWTKEQFIAFAKPYFDKGKAWSFTALERHVYFDKKNKMAWFDELLSTQMKICRGSGVLVKEKDGWKIKHYVLSMTIPNDDVSEVVNIKADQEDSLMKELKNKQ